MKQVHTADGVFENHYVCADHYGIHKDTVLYRIRANSETYRDWYYIEDQDFE